MRKRTWNIAIVGPGWVAGAYLNSFRKRDDVRVTHVVGRRLARAKAFLDQHHLDCAVHDNLRPALADKAVDIVAVLTPNNVHAEQTIAAAKARKHVIIEKPVCLTLAELKAMRAAVRAAKVRTIVGYVLRWNPLLRIIRRHVADGRLGRIIYAETDYLHGLVGKDYTKPWHTTIATSGTSLLLGGCHAVDAIRYVVGRKVVEVSAYNTGRTKELDYPGTELTLLKFDDGSIGKVGCCLECNMPYVFNVEVYGTKGSFRNNLLAGDMLKGQTGFATIPTILPDSADVSHHPFDGEIAHFIDCLNRDRRPLPDLEDAAETTQVCLAAAMSAERGRPIRLPMK
ncbi:MAG TPA: Gfo/Idh/MocA family oxidoreductase [Phycisphaerae bacterium]|nr:Gfo/Idh/MocA family oxidoreductase [Phycisphaerae bacterium]